VRASRSGYQFDWRSTVRAINGLNILSQLFGLVRRQRTNEVLFIFVVSVEQSKNGTDNHYLDRIP
jgi:hypothetical protein